MQSILRHQRAHGAGQQHADQQGGRQVAGKRHQAVAQGARRRGLRAVADAARLMAGGRFGLFGGPLRLRFAQQEHQPAAQDTAQQGRHGPEGGKDRPQQGIGRHDAVGAGLRRGDEEGGRCRPAGAVAADRGRQRNHAAGTDRQRYPQQRRLPNRRHTAAAQVAIDPLRRDEDRQQSRHQKAEQQVWRHVAQDMPAFRRHFSRKIEHGRCFTLLTSRACPDTRPPRRPWASSPPGPLASWPGRPRHAAR